MDEELYDLLKQKRKDDAIKYIRNKYDMDFKSAKETIDKMTKTLEFFEGKNRGLSKTDFSKYGSGYSNESYSYEMIDGKQHFFAYKDGEKREVSSTAIPSEILKWFEKSAEKTVDEYEDKEYRKKNIFWGILLVALIVGIYFYFN